MIGIARIARIDDDADGPTHQALAYARGLHALLPTALLRS